MHARGCELLAALRGSTHALLILRSCYRHTALRSNWIILGSTVSILGAFTGLTTTSYAYTVLRSPEHARLYNFYLGSAGVSVGGCAIWVMHCMRNPFRSSRALLP
jgi:hypothetical protein